MRRFCGGSGDTRNTRYTITELLGSCFLIAISKTIYETPYSSVYIHNTHMCIYT